MTVTFCFVLLVLTPVLCQENQGIAVEIPTDEDESVQVLEVIPLEQASQYGYVAEIELGQPPQKLKVVIDSGSSDLWVGSSELCGTVLNYCGEHNVYDSNASSTYEPINHTLIIGYTAGTARGPIGKEILRVGGREKRVLFAAVNKGNGKMFTNERSDGVLGVSYQSAALLKSDTPASTNLIEQPVYSFYLARDGEEGSKMFLGGSNPQYYEGELTYIPMNSERQLRVHMNSFQVRDLEMCGGKGCEVVIDTGSAGIVVPNSTYFQLMEKIPTYPIDCNYNSVLPPFTIQLNGLEFTLESKYYMIKYPLDNRYCVFCGARHGEDQPFVLGDVFLRKYYSEFDLKNKRIGLAPAVHSESLINKYLKLFHIQE